MRRVGRDKKKPISTTAFPLVPLRMTPSTLPNIVCLDMSFGRLLIFATHSFHFFGNSFPHFFFRLLCPYRYNRKFFLHTRYKIYAHILSVNVLPFLEVYSSYIYVGFLLQLQICFCLPDAAGKTKLNFFFFAAISEFIFI